MAKKESTLGNMLISLAVITMVSGGVLGFFYNMTKPGIDKVEKEKNDGKNKNRVLLILFVFFFTF